jgi:hypothetical protein
MPIWGLYLHERTTNAGQDRRLPPAVKGSLRCRTRGRVAGSGPAFTDAKWPLWTAGPHGYWTSAFAYNWQADMDPPPSLHCRLAAILPAATF